MKQSFDVVVIGGGTTGTAVLRDLVMRGFKNSVLLDKDDLAAGTSGGCHSALHAGSRYVISDKQTAIECVQENEIYRRICPQVIDPMDSYWICTRDEYVEFAKDWMKTADEIGLAYDVLDPEEVRKKEPLFTKDLKFVLHSVDTGFDPFRLCIAQAYDAKMKGGEIRTHHEVKGLIVEDNRVTGVKVLDKLSNNFYEIEAKVVINAAGPWSGEVTKMAGLKIGMKPNRGSTAIYGMRPTKAMFCMLRYPADGDGLVSQGFQNTALLGTSSVDVEDPNDNVPGIDEIQIMEDSMAEMIPGIRDARPIRMCAGVRPLYSEGDETGRDVSRGITLIDHAEKNGLEGFITITSGKYATARLMGELAVDIASEKLVGEVIPCTTDKELIFGGISHEEAEKLAREIHEKYHISLYAAHKFTARYGALASEILEDYPEYAIVIDDAVQMIGSEIPDVFDKEEVKDFCDARRRTRLGMGQDQGIFSIYKAAGIMEQQGTTVEDAEDYSLGYLAERWKGIYYANQYGDQLPVTRLMQDMYVGVGSYDLLKMS